MMTIYRYSLRYAEHQVISGPGLSQIVAADNQRGVIEVWGEVDTEELDVEWDVYIVGTGNPMDHIAGATHVGAMLDGMFVWHLYAGVRADSEEDQ